MGSDENNQAKKRKDYDFGKVEILSFNDFIKHHANNFNQLNVYAFIPMVDDGCTDTMPADVCMSPN